MATPATLNAPILAASSDTGTSDSDRITNETEPVFTGSAQAGATVTIYELGYAIGSGLATDGNYSIKVTSLAPGPDAITAVQTVDGVTSAPSPSTTVTLDQTLPTAYVPFQIVPHNGGATPIGIELGDNLTPVADLSVVLGLLPGNGAVTLADGTPVQYGEKLTGTQTEGLLFTPDLGASRDSLSPNLNFTLSDAAGNASFRTGVIDVASSPVPDAVSVAPTVSFRNGVFTLSGTALSGDGVKNVEISTTLDDGTEKDLGAATVDEQGNFTFKQRVGRRTQGYFTAIETTRAGNTASGQGTFFLTGGLDQDGFVAEQDAYTPDTGVLGSVSRFMSDGTRTLDVKARGQTLGTNYADTITNHYEGYNTFVYDPGHGSSIVNGFRLRDTQHDTLSFSSPDFNNSIASVLAHSYGPGDGTGVIIVDPVTQDTVQLAGITKRGLVENRGDISFHG